MSFIKPILSLQSPRNCAANLSETDKVFKLSCCLPEECLNKCAREKKGNYQSRNSGGLGGRRHYKIYWPACVHGQNVVCKLLREVEKTVSNFRLKTQPTRKDLFCSLPEKEEMLSPGFWVWKTEWPVHWMGAFDTDFLSFGLLLLQCSIMFLTIYKQSFILLNSAITQ